MKQKPRSSGMSPISTFKETQQRKFYLEKLIKAAKRLRATSVEQAQGTCLTMSLEFCLLAKEYDIPVELVMWPVKEDPIFCDHWAVRINESQVIDLTHIQVTNKLSPDVVFKIADYPPNYRIPRFYATGPLIEEYVYFKNHYGGKLPPILIKNLRSLMLKQDLMSVNHFKNFPGMTTAIFAYYKFRIYFYFSQLEERLYQRLEAIKRR